MSIPMINFKVTNADVDETLKSLAQQKLSSLDKFVKEASVICDAEFEKVAPQQNGNINRFEVNLTVDGQLHRAEATMDSFEKAVDKVRDELDKKLRRTADRKESLFKKGGRKIKEMIQGS